MQAIQRDPDFHGVLRRCASATFRLSGRGVNFIFREIGNTGQTTIGRLRVGLPWLLRYNVAYLAYKLQNMWTKAFEILGGGFPAGLAIGVYGLFHFFDKNASEEASQAITEWFKEENYKHIDLSLAMISLFDKIYSNNLKSMNAFSDR